jgi:hypothetical protein
MVKIQFGKGIKLLDHLRLKSISIQDNSIFIYCILKGTDEIALVGNVGIPEEVTISEEDDEIYIKKVIGMFERNKIKIKKERLNQ